MKNILIFVFVLSPLFLFSQLTNSRGVVINNSGKESSVNNYIQSSDGNWHLLDRDTIKPIPEEGWYIQHADRVGKYDKDGKIIWGKSSLTNDSLIITDESQGIIFEGQTIPLITKKIKTVYSDWMIETGWKALNKGRTDNCQDHNWLNASEQTGDYNTTKFEIGLSKGDMLQECRICVKCKRMETQLTFMGTGTNPFIWEATQSIYQQLLDEKK